jgi:hypothetical protein
MFLRYAGRVIERKRAYPAPISDDANTSSQQMLNNNATSPLPTENTAENAKKHSEDVHMAIVMQLLKFLIKRRAEGFKHNNIFKFKGQDVAFYQIQYVIRLAIPTPAWHDSEAQSVTECIRAPNMICKCKPVTRPKRFATSSMVKTIINKYKPLNDYFIVAAPDGKNYSVWVRADAVEEAIRWLIFTLQDYAPHYLDNFPTLVDETVRKAYEDVMRRLEGDKFKNN